MKIVVSSCLLGVACRYCGGSCRYPQIEKLKQRHQLIPVCPEIFGGLPTPRPAAEIVGGKVVNKEGKDVTAAFQKGAEETWKLASFLEADCAILKKNSPSCGFGSIYDGSFTGTLVEGMGVTAQLLHEQGLPVYNEHNFNAFIMEEE